MPVYQVTLTQERTYIVKVPEGEANTPEEAQEIALAEFKWHSDKDDIRALHDLGPVDVIKVEEKA